MAAIIRRVEGFSTMVADVPGEAYRLLARLAGAGVNLLAFTAIPNSPLMTQLILFAEEAPKLRAALEGMGAPFSGPKHAFVVQGNDQIGALVAIHRTLFDAGVNVYASNGVTDGHGGYGYILHVHDEDFESAARALGV